MGWILLRAIHKNIPIPTLLINRFWPKGTISQDSITGTKTRTGWHTDQPYWPIIGPVITTWIALDYVDDENGALEFIPGSHRWGKKYHPFLTDQLGAFVKYLKLP